jgi:hypothetical protein
MSAVASVPSARLRVIGAITIRLRSRKLPIAAGSKAFVVG